MIFSDNLDSECSIKGCSGSYKPVKLDDSDGRVKCDQCGHTVPRHTNLDSEKPPIILG